jgi:hypothetical protein
VNAVASAIVITFMVVSFTPLDKETTRRPLGLSVKLFFSADGNRQALEFGKFGVVKVLDADEKSPARGERAGPLGCNAPKGVQTRTDGASIL